MFIITDKPNSNFINSSKYLRYKKRLRWMYIALPFVLFLEFLGLSLFDEINDLTILSYIFLNFIFYLIIFGSIAWYTAKANKQFLGRYSFGRISILSIPFGWIYLIIAPLRYEDILLEEYNPNSYSSVFGNIFTIILFLIFIVALPYSKYSEKIKEISTPSNITIIQNKFKDIESKIAITDDYTTCWVKEVNNQIITLLKVDPFILQNKKKAEELGFNAAEYCKQYYYPLVDKHRLNYWIEEVNKL